ncbi:hypothetical protein RhiirA1_387517 [Rhizophagus irregularis]|uniref:Rad60/SUMO-like domain-containing protein n=1 Tax=Rhizophagus irregularis TaxID=588596 RepID=A0A2N0SHZ3_9GLOM|nr:hypothetical protein RhiirA1_387517 [Rhizophagus irregularis]
MDIRCVTILACDRVFRSNDVLWPDNSDRPLYVANVTSNTTGEVLLKEFETGVSEYEPCKLVYNGKDIRPTDTLGKLGIKKGDLVKVIWSVWENSLTIHPSLVGEAKEATRSSMLI